jgi:hypothetical protein
VVAPLSKLALFTILLTSGCTSTMVTGIEDGGIASGSSGSTGQGSNVSGSTNTGGAGSATGQVAGLSVSSAGTSGGAATTGGCLAMDATCASDSDCCSGACLNICRSPVGQGCDAGHDCSSGICSDDVCACTAPAPNQETYCASDADCCNAISCQTYVYQGVKYGQCCNPVGGACQGDWDCCDSSCVNGACACLPVEGSCSPGDCCQGACIGSSIYLGNTGACLNPAGDPCNGLR